MIIEPVPLTVPPEMLVDPKVRLLPPRFTLAPAKLGFLLVMALLKVTVAAAECAVAGDVVGACAMGGDFHY